MSLSKSYSASVAQSRSFERGGESAPRLRPGTSTVAASNTIQNCSINSRIIAALLAFTAVAPLAPATASEATSSSTVVQRLRIEQRTLVGGSGTLRVSKGDRLNIEWTTDEPLLLHVHGYELETKLEPGKPQRMNIDAYATGRFPIAAHWVARRPGVKGGSARETTLLYLEVTPR